jgi:hypothetical protein
LETQDKTRCLGKSRSTTLSNIPPSFEVKVTAAGPLYFPRTSSGQLGEVHRHAAGFIVL